MWILRLRIAYPYGYGFNDKLSDAIKSTSNKWYNARTKFIITITTKNLYLALIDN